MEEKCTQTKLTNVYNSVTLVTGHSQSLWPILIQTFEVTDWIVNDIKSSN